MGENQLTVTFLALLMVVPSAIVWPGGHVQPAAPETAGTARALAGLGGAFVENMGQLADPEVRLYARGEALCVEFTSHGARLAVRGDSSWTHLVLAPVGGGPVEPEGQGPIGHATNFFLGADPARWASGARSFSRVVYVGVWDGVDLGFSIHGGALKYELSVAPGADIGAIGLRYEGAQGLSVDPATGELLVTTAAGIVRDSRPTLLVGGQAGARAPPCEFNPTGGDGFGFSFPAGCPRDVPVVIDPGLRWSTYIGSSNAEGGLAISVGRGGDVYVAGNTESTDLATPGANDTSHNGAFDVYVAALDPTGSVLRFVTYIGGAGCEGVLSLAFAPNGSLLVAGNTSSDDFPTTGGALFPTYRGGNGDGFLAVLDPTGAHLQYCTYLGGSGDERVRFVGVGRGGDVYVCGGTGSPDLPTTPDAYRTTLKGVSDAFAMRLDASIGRVVWCTYLGGTSNESGIHGGLDGSGRLYVVGATDSTDLPATPGAFCATKGYEGDYDGFVSVLAADGSTLLHATYLGGEAADTVNDVEVGPDGTVYVTGYTDSVHFPTTPGAAFPTGRGGSDAFLAALSADLSTLDYSTYLGGSADDQANALAWGAGGRALYLSGHTVSSDMPCTVGSFDTKERGDVDLFVMGLNLSSGALEYCTYIGGSDADQQFSYSGMNLTTAHSALASDANGTLYITGRSASADFPVTIGANDTAYGGGYDAVVLKLDPEPCDLPAAPTGVRTSLPRDRTVRIDWDVPPIQGGRVLKHRLYKGDSPSTIDYAHPITLEKRFHHNDTLVENGRTYYYQVGAVNSAGEGPLSEVVSARPLGTPSAPRSPGANTSGGVVHLNWTPPADLGGEVLAYRILRGPSTMELQPYCETSRPVTTFDDANVTLGQKYYYAVSAFNSLFEGPQSEAVGVVPLRAPTEPRSLSAVAGDSRVDLSWLPPLIVGGAPILNYRIYWGTDPRDLGTVKYVPGANCTAAITGLENGATYYLLVRAFNIVGEGASTPIVNATPRGPPTAPVDIRCAPGDGHVALCWSLPRNDGGTPITGYTVLRGTGPDSLMTLATVGMATSHDDVGLKNGNGYWYAVFATNALGRGPACDAVYAVALGLPAAPDVIVEVAGSMVEVRWNPPSATGGADVTGYSLYRGLDPGSMSAIKQLAATSTLYHDADVELGVTYYYAVSATTAAGEGPSSTPQAATPFGSPGPPGNAAATADEGLVTLAWMPPSATGGKPIVGYRLYRGTDPATLALLVDLDAVTTYRDRTVQLNVTYHYAISAINERGEGPRAAFPTVLLRGPPGVPVEVNAAYADGRLTITWAPPTGDGGSPVVGYLLLRGNTSGSLLVYRSMGPVTTFEDTDVVEGGSYWYAVKAVNAIGDGSVSAAVLGSVPEPGGGGGGGGGDGAVLAVVAAIAIATVAAAAFVLSRRRATEREGVEAGPHSEGGGAEAPSGTEAAMPTETEGPEAGERGS
jgi:fibronectin type 3 domain-containing protein